MTIAHADVASPNTLVDTAYRLIAGRADEPRDWERRGSGWSERRHLAAPINSAADEGSPFVSPDKQFLYFTSERGTFTEHGITYTRAGLERALRAPGNGLGDIYRIDFRATGITR